MAFFGGFYPQIATFSPVFSDLTIPEKIVIYL
jgi:hypothetical protein